MKTFCFIILLQLHYLVYGQQNRIHTRHISYDSIHVGDPLWENLFEEHNNRLKLYEKKAVDECYKIDTVKTDKNIVVTVLSKTYLPLKRTVNYLDSLGCIFETSDEYYNSRGLISYSMWYYKSRKPESFNLRERLFSGMHFERFEYDDNDHLILRVYDISMAKLVKEVYHIESNGTWKREVQRIAKTDFWK